MATFGLLLAINRDEVFILRLLVVINRDDFPQNRFLLAVNRDDSKKKRYCSRTFLLAINRDDLHTFFANTLLRIVTPGLRRQSGRKPTKLILLVNVNVFKKKTVKT